MPLLRVGDADLDYRYEPACSGAEGRAPLVFLHEGLGSLELWRDFPDAVRSAAGGPALLVHSRAGYGHSTPLRTARGPRYMHDEALDVLPAVLAALSLRNPVLIGHSDGASIALIHAGAGHAVAGLVLLAPHVFVEERTLDGIRRARHAYETTDLPMRLARYHADAEATFRGWNDVWLSDAFRHWNIEEYLPGVTCPVLLVQGDADEYGSLSQLDAVERGVRGPVTRVVHAGGGHAPHLDHPDETLAAIANWLATLR